MAPSAELFRELFMLDPEVTYLNHGSFGAVPRPVFERQNGLRRELELEPVLFLARRLPSRLAQVRRSIARYVGATTGDDLGLVPNVTTGLNAVARSLELRRGDEILLTDHEYGAKRILWDEVAARAGARVVVATLPRPALGEDELFDAVAARFTARTRVLFVSHITSLSALVLPVARLSALAHERSVVSIVDGAHGPGQIDLELPSIGCDMRATCTSGCARRAEAGSSGRRATLRHGSAGRSSPGTGRGRGRRRSRAGSGGAARPTRPPSSQSRPRSGSSGSTRGARCGGAATVSRSRPWPRSRPRPVRFHSLPSN